LSYCAHTQKLISQNENKNTTAYGCTLCGRRCHLNGASVLRQHVGYINQSIPAGFSLVANHLNNSPDNRVISLFSAAPDQTVVYKFNPATDLFTFARFADGEWEGDTSITLGPGEGAFVSAPAAFTQTFVGEVPLTSTVNVAAGFSIASSALPQSLPISQAPPAGLGYPVAELDQVFRFNPQTQLYTLHRFVDGEWEGGEPSPAIGEAFWLNNAGAAKSWNRTFTVGP